MNFITFFITFIIFYIIFHWIIKKTDIHNKLSNKSRKHKYFKYIVILILVFFAFSFEYGKQLLNDKYGQHNYISTVIGAFLGSIYMNFIPVIFRRSNP